MKKLKEMNPGERFGINSDEPRFLVLEQKQAGTAVVLLEKWNTIFDEDENGCSGTTNYVLSKIRTFIEEKIEPTLKREVGEENLLLHTASLETFDGQNKFGSVQCLLRPMTYWEIKKYSRYMDYDEKKENIFWTMTPWGTEERDITYGNINDQLYDTRECHSGSAGITILHNGTIMWGYPDAKAILMVTCTLNEEMDVIPVAEPCQEQLKRSTVLGRLSPGDEFLVGGRRYVVLEQMYGNTAVVTKDLVDKGLKFDECTRLYKDSSLRQFVEGRIYDRLQYEADKEYPFRDKSIFRSHRAFMDALDGVSMGDFLCLIRPMTYEEARKYSFLLENYDIEDDYWTITPWASADTGSIPQVVSVSECGVIESMSCSQRAGLRIFAVMDSSLPIQYGSYKKK